MAFEIPGSCTLPSAERPIRLKEFDDLLQSSVRRADRLSSTQLTLHLQGGDELEERARDLAARETECCSFFDFAVTTGEAEVVLRVEVPAQHADILDSLQVMAGSTV